MIGHLKITQIREKKLTHYVPNRQRIKFISEKFTEMLCPSFIKLRIQEQRANSVDPDEVAHYEPPHLALHCIQIPQFSFWCFRC